MKSFLAIAAAALLVTTAHASHVIGNVAKSGQKVMVTDMFWQGTNCEGVDLTYQLISPPANGTVTQRKARAKLDSAALRISPPARCDGKVLPISFVYYQSKKGFTGTDSFTVRWTSALGEVRERTYTLTVQ